MGRVESCKPFLSTDSIYFILTCIIYSRLSPHPRFYKMETLVFLSRGSWWFRGKSWCCFSRARMMRGTQRVTKGYESRWWLYSQGPLRPTRFSTTAGDTDSFPQTQPIEALVLPQQMESWAYLIHLASEEYVWIRIVRWQLPLTINGFESPFFFIMVKEALSTPGHPDARPRGLKPVEALTSTVILTSGHKGLSGIACKSYFSTLQIPETGSQNSRQPCWPGDNETRNQKSYFSKHCLLVEGALEMMMLDFGVCCVQSFEWGPWPLSWQLPWDLRQPILFG